MDRTSLLVWRARGFAKWKRERTGTMSVEGCILDTAGVPELRVRLLRKCEDETTIWIYSIRPHCREKQIIPVPPPTAMPMK